MMSTTLEQILLLADPDVDLTDFAARADQLEVEISAILGRVDAALVHLDANDPLCLDLEEIRVAAAIAAGKLEQLPRRTRKPHLFVVP